MSDTPTSLPLDPEPWACWPFLGATETLRHTREHEGYVAFEPREGYEQDEDKYPDEFFEEN